MDISLLKKSSSANFSKISSAFEKIANPSTGGGSSRDDRFWRLESDKAGNGTATIRFLPSTDGESLPWVRMFSYGFQGPSGKWYIENSLTTLDETDPVAELNSRLYNSTEDKNSPARLQASKQRRRLSYISNILVVSDPKNPENEGKVFLFKYGKKIFDKLMDKARPAFEDEQPVNVFDYWEGANFKLRVRKLDGFTNYDQSTFSDAAPIARDDDEVLSIAAKQYDLKEFLDRKNFKSYDELKAKLASVLEDDGGERFTAENLSADDSFKSEPAVEFTSKPAPQPVAKAAAIPEINDDDDTLSYFQKLAEED